MRPRRGVAARRGDLKKRDTVPCHYSTGAEGARCGLTNSPIHRFTLYFEYNSTTNCSCAAIGMFGRGGRSSIRPLNVSRSTASQASGAPRDDCSIDGEHGLQLTRLLAHAHLFARRDHVARDVDALAVHLDVAVTNELARAPCGWREAHAVDHVVETALERGEQVVARDARERGHPLERVAELLFADAVDALDLLLLAELLGVLRRLAAAAGALAVLPRRVRTALDGALLGEALGALEEQLGAFAPALPAARSGVATMVQTLRRLGGRQPLCGIGVTSLIDLTCSPAVASA